eukprot:445007-Rhodomonas_salina.1
MAHISAASANSFSGRGVERSKEQARTAEEQRAQRQRALLQHTLALHHTSRHPSTIPELSTAHPAVPYGSSVRHIW